MSTKKQRREAAQRKAKNQRIAIMAMVATCLAAVIAGMIFIRAIRPDTRVFEIAGGQSVSLYGNGRFVADLFHDMNVSGTFTEDVDGNVSTISFTADGSTIQTHIMNNILILPAPWRATCVEHMYNIEFALRDSGTRGVGVLTDDDDIIVISDLYFGMQVEYIQWNREDYLGRTIRFEGQFFSIPLDDEMIFAIMREEDEDGCCGGGAHGFEVYLNDFAPFADDTWVEITGILEEFYVEGAGQPLIRLNVIALEEL